MIILPGQPKLAMSNVTNSCSRPLRTPDLDENILRGDGNYLSTLDAADAYVTRTAIDLPEEPEARDSAHTPIASPTRCLNSISSKQA